MENELILLVLLPASLFDLSRYRIPNAIPVAGLIISLIRRLELHGVIGVCPWLAGMVIPLILYYIFFKLRMFGASDGKLMAAVGSFVGAYGVFKVTIFSLMVGAVMSVFKLIINRNFIARFYQLKCYFLQTVKTGKLSKYYDKKTDGETGVIPYGVAVGFGTIIYLLLYT